MYTRIKFYIILSKFDWKETLNTKLRTHAVLNIKKNFLEMTEFQLKYTSLLAGHQETPLIKSTILVYGMQGVTLLLLSFWCEQQNMPFKDRRYFIVNDWHTNWNYLFPIPIFVVDGWETEENFSLKFGWRTFRSYVNWNNIHCSAVYAKEFVLIKLNTIWTSFLDGSEN